MSEQTAPRVLVIAEEANPEWPSVPLVGWSMAQALRAEVDATVVTQVRNQEAIERAGFTEADGFAFIDSEKVARPMWRLGQLAGNGWTVKTALGTVSYGYFERLIWDRFGDDLKAGRYDLVHRVTPVSPAAVSPLAKRCADIGVPFIMGPINGGVPWPKGFEAERKREGEHFAFARGLYKLYPGRRAMLDAARAVIVGGRFIADEIPQEFRDKLIYMPENAIDTSRFNRVAEQSPEGPLRACFIGRLVPCKGMDMLIEAAAPLLSAGQMTLDMIGDGPDRGLLEETAARFGSTGVTFHGMLPHQEVQDVAVSSHVLTFPSIREFGGGAVVEAMSLGVVPIVVDYGGPADLVSEDTGFKVPLGTRDEVIARLRALLEQLVADRSGLIPMGEAARARVESHFTWGAKARQMREIYDWAKEGNSPPPQFFD